MPRRLVMDSQAVNEFLKILKWRDDYLPQLDPVCSSLSAKKLKSIKVYYG